MIKKRWTMGAGRWTKVLAIFLSIFYLPLSIIFSYAQEDSTEYVNKAWALKGASNFAEVHKVCDEVINKFSAEADRLAGTLTAFPPQQEESAYKIMNDVAICYFIKGETLRDEGSLEEAVKVLKEGIKKYPYSQGFDPSRGTFWSVKDTSQTVIDEIEGTIKDETWEPEKDVLIELYDKGDFPVDYSKYGQFSGLGTKDYKYEIKDPIGLSKAVGEGIYPNTTSIKFDPEFIKLKKGLSNIDHWKVLNGRDFRTAFYKWNIAPEPQGVRQFYIADILERSGLIEQAIKSYYAVLVNFPKEYGWTYWHTPWYIGKASLYRIKYLLREHPELGLKLEGASIEIEGGFDNDIRNDVFIVNPGKLVKINLWDKMVCSKADICLTKPRKLGKIIQTRGGDKAKVVKYENGDWQILVDNKPFMIKGITYGPTKVGESPDKGTQQNWTLQDTNKNSIIDASFEAWVDLNGNNTQDTNEPAVGDFGLMKEMGINCIRLYHQPFKINKEVIRQMHAKYGIYVILGDFLGKYALGSKAPWNPGTDYDNPEHRKNMLESVKEMVLEFRDEDAVLIWILGNENVYGVACNADKKPESFFKFANEAALLIKSLDPKKRPVAIASGDTLYLDVFAKNSPDIDIFGANCYRGKYGFLDFWDEVKRVADRAAIITEYGAPSIAKSYSMEESENYQAGYHKAAWVDISCNSAGFGAGDSVGGIVFEWLDEWWKAYAPFYHDKKALFAGPFLDGFMHEEWLGLAGQGDGKHSPFMRHLKKAYYMYESLWN
ncbi:MAG: glycoside hydrolase family 2 TIM barrel-domain containing protein [Candidatus Omnitrophica bacterium]|nr:glycoside hydrolase family 2 TIM barrel-domain containing protein [Candidatus Omnitrophota bacterium]